MFDSMLPDASQINPTLRQTASSYGKGTPPMGAPPRQTENARRWSATSCSPTGYPAVPSALGGLTSGFGMGPGVPPLPWSLTNEGHSSVRGEASAVPWGPHSATSRRPVSKRIAGTEKEERRARPISTARLNALPRLHLQPINLVVYQGPYRRENSSWDWLPA